MTDTRDPRYIRTVGLTLLAALLVVASCQVEQLSINIEVEQPPTTVATEQITVDARGQMTPDARADAIDRAEDIPRARIAEFGVEEPAVEEVREAVEEVSEVVDELRDLIEALREANRQEPQPGQAEPQETGREDVAAIQAGPAFTPMTVRPDLLNRSEVQQALMRLYPPVLRDAGIGGQVTVWFYISEEGTVLDRRISRSSGHMPLDEAALGVADVFRFSPALNREQVVPVWIQLPITFQVQARPR